MSAFKKTGKNKQTNHTKELFVVITESIVFSGHLYLPLGACYFRLSHYLVTIQAEIILPLSKILMGHLCREQLKQPCTKVTAAGILFPIIFIISLSKEFTHVTIISLLSDTDYCSRLQSYRKSSQAFMAHL